MPLLLVRMKDAKCNGIVFHLFLDFELLHQVQVLRENNLYIPTNQNSNVLFFFSNLECYKKVQALYLF